MSTNTLASRRGFLAGSLATGIAGTGYGIGQASMNPLLQHLCSEFGWRNALRIAAAMMLVNVSVAAYTMRQLLYFGLGGNAREFLYARSVCRSPVIPACSSTGASRDCWGASCWR